jgi:hypothetical protein
MRWMYWSVHCSSAFMVEILSDKKKKKLVPASFAPSNPATESWGRYSTLNPGT